MSTILDALKKSEQERKLNKLPTLNDMQAPQEPSRWPLIVAIVLSFLAIIAMLASFVWWQSTDQAMSEKPELKLISNEAIGATATLVQAPVVETAATDDVVINAVSYAEDPAQRFAMIDGKVVREGEFVRAGLRLEKIQSKAVVLNLRGKQITRTP